MSIFLKEIHVRNLGPHNEFSMEFGKFNLVYGHNENGKTFLVEFIIRSLFRQAGMWNLRGHQGRGKVILSGLNGKAVEFSPSSSKKLEDFLGNVHPGLPADFARLLVVKGAEVDIAKVAGGVDRNVLKRLLSNRQILDDIQKGISKTIQEADLQKGLITGPNRGELSARQDLKRQLEKIEHLFSEIDNSYSGGRRKMLSETKRKLESDRDKMEHAKQYLAYNLDKEIAALKKKTSQVSSEVVTHMRSELALYKQKVNEYKQKQLDQNQAEERSRNYEWLKHAQTVYQSHLTEPYAEPRKVMVAVILFFAACSGVLAFLKMPLFALLALAGSLVAGFLFFKQYQELIDLAKVSSEIDELRQTFTKYFNRPLNGLPDILQQIGLLEEDYNNARLLKNQLRDDLNQLHTMKLKLADRMVELIGENRDPKKWDETLRLLDEEASRVESELREKELFLAQLSVDRSDYRQENPGVEYSKQVYQKLEERIADMQTSLDEENQNLTGLKQLVCRELDEDIATPWEILIGRLTEKREDLACLYKEKTAEILGKIAVCKVLQELRDTEDSKVLSNLESEIVQAPVKQITGRYTNVFMDGERFMVSDPYHNFELSELSSGAQEQVLLALRIGFGSKLMQGHSMFLILDDAFQYSDWPHRKMLVDKITELAQAGWQIIYFSMDDNIRDLFERNGRIFGEDYRFCNLNDRNRNQTQQERLEL